MFLRELTEPEEPCENIRSSASCRKEMRLNAELTWSSLHISLFYITHHFLVQSFTYTGRQRGTQWDIVSSVVLSALRLHFFTKCFLLTNTLLFNIGVIHCNAAHSCLMMCRTGIWLFTFVQNHFVFMLQVSSGFFGFKFDVVRLVWAQISPG